MMRVSVFLVGLIGTAVTALPTNELTPSAGRFVVGRVCTGVGLTGHCIPLNMSMPNSCEVAMDTDPEHLSPIKLTQSLEITAHHPCAFFAAEACINPTGIHSLFVQGPTKVFNTRLNMSSDIGAYICGEGASVFAPNASTNPGTVIVTKQRDTPNILEFPYDPESPVINGTGAVLYRAPDLGGNNVAVQDLIGVPGNNECLDLTQIFGSWDGAPRSLVVYKAKECHFYTEYRCPAKTTKPVMVVGFKDKHQEIHTLSAQFDQQIHSILCHDI